MNDSDTPKKSNFIRQIVESDLAAGKHATIQTRFPPEPNGYLHIGHAKSICLNFGVAAEYTTGKNGCSSPPITSNRCTTSPSS